VTVLSLHDAEKLARFAIESARAKALHPMSLAVIDASLNLKFALREDGAGCAGIDIATGKARAALSFGCSSRQIADALAANPLAGPGVTATLGGRVLLLAGGVLILDADGVPIGAIAAAGDSPDNDEAVVMAAITRAGGHPG
jgi:uncharacterized protein GlcG (DUF336 family)